MGASSLITGTAALHRWLMNRAARAAAAGTAHHRTVRPGAASNGTCARAGVPTPAGDEDRGHPRDWLGVVCHADAECPDVCGAPLQPPLFQAIHVEPHETAQVVPNHSVEQADDLAGRPGAWGDTCLRDEDRLAREAPDQREPRREYAGEGLPGALIPVDPDPVHVGRAWPPRL